MTRVLSTSIAALAVGIMATSAAHSADIGLKDTIKSGTDVPYEAKRSWTGLWMAAVGGYQMDMSKLSHRVATEDFFQEEHTDGVGNGGLFGEIQLGFDKQIGNRLVLGVFGGVNMDDSEFETGGSGNTDGGYSYTEATYEKKWGAVVGPRVGFLTSENTMIYVAGGVAFGEIGKVRAGEDGELTDSYKKQETDLFGLFGELGLETRLKDLGDNVYFKVAGRYTDLDAIKLDHHVDKFYGIDVSSDTDLDRNELVLMGGFTVKLGGTLPYLGD